MIALLKEASRKYEQTILMITHSESIAQAADRIFTGVRRGAHRFREVPGVKHYLSLAPISAKVRKRQNQMTLLCIVIAVLLVTTIFSMADMAIRMEKIRVIESHGNWHVMLKEPANQVVGACLSWDAFLNLAADADRETLAPVCFVRFSDGANSRKVISELQQTYGFPDETLSENTALLGLTGFSSDPYVSGLYLVAAILFLLVLAAGVFMIAGSLNSRTAERIQFFGMLRCIGASRTQVTHIVRLKALSWCETAVPIGVILGILATWLLCALLRHARRGRDFGAAGMYRVTGAFGPRKADL